MSSVEKYRKSWRYEDPRMGAIDTECYYGYHDALMKGSVNRLALIGTVSSKVEEKL